MQASFSEIAGTLEAGGDVLTDRNAVARTAGAVQIRDAVEGDFAAIVGLNLESEHFVSPMDASRLRALHQMAAMHRVVADVATDAACAFLHGRGRCGALMAISVISALPALRRAVRAAWRWSNASVLAWLFTLAPAVWAQQPAIQLQRFPDVLSATVRASSANSFDFDVTVASPYDTPQRYADGFRVTRLSGEVLGERTLSHDHQTEQPFTRELYGVRIPAQVRVVRIQARDQKHGYGGRSVALPLPGRP